MADRLTDRFLLLHCNQNLDQLTFLSKPTLVILSKLHDTAAHDDADVDLLSRRDDLGKLWRELLVDSIHALKVRDRREKAYQTGFRVDDPAKTLQARDQNVYGIEELAAYFASFGNFERVLYGSENTYRDHITHVIRVWLIGLYLLTSANSIDDVDIGFPPICQSSPARTDRHEPAPSDGLITVQERWAMWTVVALCHDLGYPLERTHRINDAIDEMLAHFGNITVGSYRYSFQAHHQALNDVTLRMISSKVEDHEQAGDRRGPGASKAGRYCTAVQTKYYTKFAHSFEEFHHGAISCLVLMKTLIYFMEADYAATGGALTLEDARQFHIRREILRSIASHTCPEVYHLQINTFSFLLIVCDELQQWGRPTFRDMKLGNTGLGVGAKVEVPVCGLKAGHLEAVLEYGPDANHAAQVRSKFRFFHKLLRAAIEDQRRQINFRWQVTATGGKQHVFEYKSSRPSFKELSYTVGGKSATSKLWEEPKT